MTPLLLWRAWTTMCPRPFPPLKLKTVVRGETSMLRSWKNCLSAACLGVVFAVAAPAAQAAGFGTLTGQYVYDGAVPTLPAIVMKGDATAKDAAVCAAADVPD